MLSGQRFPILRSLSQEASLYAPQLVRIALPVLGLCESDWTDDRVVKLSSLRK